VALVERRLPWCMLDVCGHAGSAHWSAIIGDHGAIGLTPARALVAALIQTEIAKAQKRQP
jgi:methenyltetrahydromethanopterin cyclohydrolase